MNPRVLAQISGMLGGLAWLIRWGADLAGNDPSWGGGGHWIGLGLLGVSVGLVGAGTVSKGAVWLRVIVGVAAPLLAWSVYAVIKGDSAGIVLDGVLGLAAAIVAGLGLLRTRPRRTPLGAHAATR